jgi:hypothetical protein
LSFTKTSGQIVDNSSQDHLEFIKLSGR